MKEMMIRILLLLVTPAWVWSQNQPLWQKTVVSLKAVYTLDYDDKRGILFFGGESWKKDGKCIYQLDLKTTRITPLPPLPHLEQKCIRLKLFHGELYAVSAYSTKQGYIYQYSRLRHQWKIVNVETPDLERDKIFIYDLEFDKKRKMLILAIQVSDGYGYGPYFGWIPSPGGPLYIQRIPIAASAQQVTAGDSLIFMALSDFLNKGLFWTPNPRKWGWTYSQLIFSDYSLKIWDIAFLNNSVYLATNYFVFRWDFKQKTTFLPPVEFRQNESRTLTTFNDTLWAGTQTGLYRLNNDKWLLEFSPPNLVTLWDILITHHLKAVGGVTRVNSLNEKNVQGVIWWQRLRLPRPPLKSLPIKLFQNYPNPFDDVTIIKFDVYRPVLVRLEIYNVLGQRIKTLVDKQLRLGRYQVSWGGIDYYGRRIPSGIYFVKITAEDYNQTKKITKL